MFSTHIQQQPSQPYCKKHATDKQTNKHTTKTKYSCEHFRGKSSEFFSLSFIIGNIIEFYNCIGSAPPFVSQATSSHAMEGVEHSNKMWTKRKSLSLSLIVYYYTAQKGEKKQVHSLRKTLR